MDDITQAVESAYQRLSDGVSGFRQRDSQKEMIEQVTRVFDAGDKTRLMAIEGRTGTGKTLGYLLPALIGAKANEKTLVVATATAALQDQLCFDELPKIRAHAGLDFKVAVAKGRSRYMCPTRLSQALESGQSTDPEMLSLLLKDWSEDNWSGCIDDLHAPISPGVWRMIHATSRSCPGPAWCGKKGLCPFHRSRAAIQSADLVVANQDMVLADLGLGGGYVLPDPEQTYYVFDEGHHLPDKAVSQQTRNANLLTLKDDISKSVQAMEQSGDAQTTASVQQDQDLIQTLLPQLVSQIERLSFEAPRGEAQEKRYRAPYGRMPQGMTHIAAELTGPLARIAKALDDAIAAAESKSEDKDYEGIATRRWLIRAGILADAMHRHADLFEHVVDEPDQTDATPNARWIVHTPDAGHTIYVAPITAAPFLARELWDVCSGAVITSATLTALNSWGRFQSKAGLSKREDTGFARVESPFDYARAARLRIPEMRNHGGNAIEHTKEIIGRLPDDLALCRTGTLVLFASRHQMSAVYRALGAEWQDAITTQDQLPRGELMAYHSERIRQGQMSVLFGLASMAEGVDLPGALCEHVVIVKLPFAPPSEPIDATRAEWLRERGRDPFKVLALPDTSLRLIQACGRLIRSETDRGVISVLDRRLRVKRYGAALVQALPPYSQETAA